MRTSRIALPALLLPAILMTASATAGAQPCSHFDRSAQLVARYADVAEGKIEFADGLLYSQQQALQIHDLTDPLNPVLVGTLAGGGWIRAIAVKDAMFVAITRSGYDLLATDVSDPSQPVRIGDHDGAGALEDVATDGELAYVAMGTSSGGVGFRALDWPDSGDATIVQSMWLDWGLEGDRENHSIILHGNHAVILASSLGNGLFTVDISDPPTAFFDGRYPFNGVDLCAAGERVYIARGFDGIEVVDTTSWTSVGTIPVVGYAEHVVIQDDLLHVLSRATAPDDSIATPPMRLGLFDVAGSPPFEQLASIELQSDAAPIGLAATSGLAVCAADEQWIIDTSHPGTVSPVATLPLEGQDMVGIGDYGFVTAGSDFVVLDLEDPSDPAEITRRTMTAPGGRMTADGNRVLVVQEPDSLVVFDVSLPADPVRVGSLHFDGITDVTTGDGWTALSTVQGAYTRIDVLDAVDDPASQIEVSAFSQPTFLQGSASRLIFTRYPGELQVYDLSDVHDPQFAGSTAGVGNATDLAVEGDLAFVASWAGVAIVDVSDPFLPELEGVTGSIQSLPTTLRPRVAASGNVVYVGQEQFGVGVHDVSDPALPIRLGTLNPRGSTHFVRVQGNEIYAGSGWSELDPDPLAGLEIYPLQCDPTLVAAPPELPTTSSALIVRQPSPNPFNPRTTLRYRTDRAADVLLEVYDLRGRKITTARRSAGPGWHEWTWDGKDLDGHAVSSGVYFARVTAGVEHRVVRMALIR